MVHQTVSEQSNSSLNSNTKLSTAGITDHYHQNVGSRFRRLFGDSGTRPSNDAASGDSQQGSGCEADTQALDVAVAHSRPSPAPNALKLPSINGPLKPPKTVSGNHIQSGLASSLRCKHGMTVKGRTIYVRWKIPARFQSIIGRTHFVRSLKTGRWADAARMARIVSIEFENMLREAEGMGAVVLGALNGPPSGVPKPHKDFAEPNDVTLEALFKMFINDPSKKRALNTMARYNEIMPIVYEVIPPTTPIRVINRSMCRRFLEMIQWLPTNATKRFPNMGAKELSEYSKAQNIKRLLSPQTINFYMINLTAVLNFAVSEELMDRNPAKGLRVADPVKAKDKRLPYSDDQLTARITLSSHLAYSVSSYLLRLVLAFRRRRSTSSKTRSISWPTTLWLSSVPRN